MEGLKGLISVGIKAKGSVKAWTEYEVLPSVVYKCTSGLNIKVFERASEAVKILTLT